MAVSLLEARRQILLNTPHIATASGSIVTFNTDLSANLKECKIHFHPVQAGSGDPSPTNVRPITGFDGITVYHSGSDTTTPLEIPISFGRTIYGGYVDLAKGELWETWHRLTIDQNVNFGFGTNMYNGTEGTNRIVPCESDRGSATSPRWSNHHINKIKTVQVDTWSNPNEHIWESCFNARTQMHIVFDNATVGITTNMTTAERSAAIKSWLADNPMEAVYPLETPRLITVLTPQAIKTLKGINNIWSDANGDVEVKFWKH